MLYVESDRELGAESDIRAWEGQSSRGVEKTV